MVVDSEEGMMEGDEKIAAKTKINKYLNKEKQKIIYTYDFGDNWEHVLTLKKILQAEKGVVYPRCIDGKGACPPEDCGGIWGYEELLKVLKNPKNSEHKNMREWVGLEDGEEWDENLCDIDEINDYLADLA